MHNEGQSLDDIMSQSEAPEAKDEQLITDIKPFLVELKRHKAEKGGALKSLNYRLPEDYHGDLKLIADWADVTMEDIMVSLIEGLRNECLEPAIKHQMNVMRKRLKNCKG